MSDPSPTHGLWADLNWPDSTPDGADFTVIGVPYDGAASARKGAAKAPERIRFWSQHLTPFSEDRTRSAGTCACATSAISRCRTRRAISRRSARRLRSCGTYRSCWAATTPSASQCCRASGIATGMRRLGVLWLDAHPDLCDKFTGSKLSHACVMRRGAGGGHSTRGRVHGRAALVGRAGDRADRGRPAFTSSPLRTWRDAAWRPWRQTCSLRWAAATPCISRWTSTAWIRRQRPAQAYRRPAG